MGEKYETWDDVNQSYYRIYEVINMKTAVYDADDIIVDISNTSVLSKKGIPEDEYENNVTLEKEAFIPPPIAFICY